MRFARTFVRFQFLISALLLTLGLWSTASFAVDFPSKPIANYYVDDANLISPPAREQVNQILSKLYKDKGIVMYVVTIPSFAEEKAPDTTIENYTTGLAEKWGLNGTQDNYSILFVISRDNKFARFQLGNSWKISYGAKTQQILDEMVVPDFRTGNFSEGVVNGVKAVDAMVRSAPVDVLPKKVTMDRKPVLAFGGLIIILILVAIALSWRKSDKKKATGTKPRRKYTRRKKTL